MKKVILSLLIILTVTTSVLFAQNTAVQGKIMSFGMAGDSNYRTLIQVAGGAQYEIYDGLLNTEDKRKTLMALISTALTLDKAVYISVDPSFGNKVVHIFLVN
jgi:hypothetical protein